MSPSASAAPAAIHSLCARASSTSASIYSAIIVIVVLVALLGGDSSRVRAAPTETAAVLAAATAAASHAANTTAATAISEPDPRPAALRRDAGLLAAELAELVAAEAASAATAVAEAATGATGGGIGGGIGGGTGTGGGGGGTGSAAGNRVDNVTRLHGGDVFNAYDAESCITDTCVGLSSGTAGLFPKNDLNDARKYRPEAAPATEDCRCQCLPHLTTFREDLNICVDDVHECTLAPFVSGSTSEKIPFVFLPLRGQIIYPSKEISFHGVKSPICAVSGAQYLTTTGWMELRNPIDADVPFRLFRDEGRTFLQWLGEADLRNKMQGRLVLVHLMCRDMSKSTATLHVSPAEQQQQLGSSSSYATGQSALVAAASNQNIFSPCVAFRVVGQPVKMTNNVTEVSFQPETQTTAITSTIGLSTKEYVAITICSLLLGLIYVASVLLYLYVKKRKSGQLSNSNTSSGTPGDGSAGSPTIATTLNEQVTFGTGFSRSSSLHSGGFGGKIRDGNSFIGDPRRESLRAHQHAAAAAASAAAASSVTSGSGSGLASIYGRHGIQSTAGGGLSGVEILGVIKSNPLLKHYPNFDGPAEFPSDLSGSDLEGGDDEMQHQHILQRHHQMHPLQRQMRDMVDGMSGPGSAAGAGKKTNTLSYSEGGDEYDNNDAAQAQGNGEETECLPEENISIVEDHLSADEKLENMKAIVNGTLRRKLYFNPAYFEPHLLMSPPAAAIEFLNKIREVISIAKYKMATKRYQPSLVVIPEEGAGGQHQRPANLLEQLTESESYQLHGIQRNGMQTPQSQIGRCKSSASSGTGTSCVGCPGCAAAAAADPNAPAGHNNRSDCRNCGDKRNSIRKWLEDVSTHENGDGGDADEHNILEKLLDMPLMDALPEAEQRSERRARTAEPNSGSDTDTIKANSLDSKRSHKRMAPAPPSPRATAQPAAPKIITHYLKQDIAKSSNEQQQLEINNNQHNMMRNSKNSAAPFGEAAKNNKTYDKMELLTQLTQTAGVGELFNNPQFKHHPPYDPSQLSTAQTAVPAKSDYDVMRSLKQHMPDMIYEAMAKDYSKRKIISNQQQQQHLEHAHLANHLTIPIQLPHPDYDDNSLSKKFYDDIPAYVHVPTPDYNTYGRSKQNPQPDSPIYKRKSPHHLIVDYETDSLERNSTAHRRHAPSHGQGSTTPMTTPANTLRRPASGAPTTKSPVSRTDTTTTTGSSSLTSSSDASSQPSPSLSTALPLEEEVEIQHTMVYDRAEGYRKGGDVAGRISFANLLQVQQQQHGPAGRLGHGSPPELPAKQPRIQYNTPSHGSMTIEVEHSPSEYELSTDSEQFEPDTLDRKAARRSSVSSLAGGGSAIVNLWTQHLTKASSEATMRHSSMENISSLPADVIHPTTSAQQSSHQAALVLRSSGSFKSNSLSNFSALNVQSGGEPRLQKNFNSLREIYEAKNQQSAVPLVMDTHPAQQQPSISKDLTSSEREREMGRLLTLEARHSRRQRQTGGTLKKPMPPDVVPNGRARSSATADHASDTQSYYDRPKTPAKPIRPPPTVESLDKPAAPHHYELYQKNLSGWTGNSNAPSAAGNSNSHKTNKSRDSTTTSTSATTNTNTTATTSDDDDAPHNSYHRHHGTFETRSNSSESTEVTGVSDTQLTSDSDAMRRRRQQRRAANSANSTTAAAPGSVSQQSSVARKYSKVNKSRPASQPPPLPSNPQPQPQPQPPIEILKNFMSSGVAGGDMSDFSDTSTIKSGSTNFLYQSSAKPFASGGASAPLALAELDHIEIASAKSLSVHSVPLSRDQGDYEHVQAHANSPEANNNDTGSINHEQLLYDLTRPANHFHYGQPAASQQLATTKVYRCEVNPSSNGMQIALGLKDRVKKTKDLKYAWKRFVNIATGKFAGSAGNSGNNSPNGTTSKTFALDDCRLSLALSDGDEGISSIHDDSLGASGSTAAAQTTQGLVSRTASGNSQRSGGRPTVGAAAVANGGRHDPDSGYMSADSNESKLNSKRLYERFNFRGSRTASAPTLPAVADLAPLAGADVAAAAAPKRMQDITEAAGELELAPTAASSHQKPSVTGFIPKQLCEPIEVNVFSSDDEKFSSEGRDSSDEDDDEEDEDLDGDGRSVAGLDDDLCGSGAESVETNSVFFRNVRKSAAPAPPKN